ncbi:MAG TPA: hypothetical protein VID04_15515 [Methylomirabilota bacterium]
MAATPAPAAAKPAQPDASAPAKSPPTERSLGDKLHDDWQTIKREGEASPGEIKKAFRDLWEQLTRWVRSPSAHASQIFLVSLTRRC